MNTLNTLLPVSRMLDAAFRGNVESWDDEDRAYAATPRADILEGNEAYHIIMDLPGVKNEDLDISLENQTLSVTAERKMEIPEEFHARRRERAGNATFSRSFTLSNAVNVDKIGATFDRGVLTIVLPKSEKSLPRRIEVK